MASLRNIVILEAFYTHNNDKAINRAAIVPTAYTPLINNITELNI